ncbi:MAG TPA: hypothetical protein VMV89_04380 [Candidatus Paceibacterota bacterium]|nr:hypothetical protein [Candidatus Paceibacterota bacterium]
MADGKRKKTQASKSKSKKTDWTKDVLGNWAEAADKNDCDALGLNDAPEWVVNALVECVSIVFPSGLPSVDKYDGRFLGEFLGRLRGLESLFAGEVPLDPEAQAEKEKIEAIAKNKSSVKLPKGFEKDVLTKFGATREAISLATMTAASASYKDAVGFHKGLARGIEIKPDELATSRTFKRHTRTYFILAQHWRFWVKCKSLREVYGHLCKAVGEQKIGSFKTFEKVCKKINFKLRGRGRPKAAK